MLLTSTSFWVNVLSPHTVSTTVSCTSLILKSHCYMITALAASWNYVEGYIFCQPSVLYI